MSTRGLTFVGTRTRAATETVRFAEDVLGLRPRREHDSDAVFFDLADGSTYAVDEVGETERHRFVHLRGPDGRLYELVEEKASTGG